jgi:hypothetical protein
MGLCTPFTICPVCEQPLGESAKVIGFPDLVPMISEFGDFYDSCAHQVCIQNWKRRDEFIEYFNSLVSVSGLGEKWKLYVLPDGRVAYERDRHAIK